MEDKEFYIAIIVSFLLTLWLGWYAIIVLVILSIGIGVYLYITEKGKDGNAFFASLALSFFSVVLVAICMLFRGCVTGINSGPSYEKIERRTKIHTIDGDKMPTISDEGEYHNAGTGERQIEYGGSREQQQDIKAADRLIENGY